MERISGGGSVNVCLVLRHREYCAKYFYRKNLNILRTLISKGSRTYKKMAKKLSSRSIACEGSRIYFDNYRECFYGWRSDGIPHHRYSLSSLPSQHKIEDALLCLTQPETIPMKFFGHNPCLLAITSHGWLIRYDLNTGVVLEEIFLSPCYKFKDIAWDNEQYSAVIRSTYRRVSPLERQAGIDVSCVMVLMVFTVFPLEFVGMLEINKKVFGKDVSSAMISQGFLIVMHQSGYVQMYSFEYIVQKYKHQEVHLHQPDPKTGKMIGVPPDGLPLNINITVCPPVLLKVQCAEHNVQIGGFPWHYLICPFRKQGCFQVYCLENKAKAQNGDLEIDEPSIEPHRAMFHPDDSGRIVHIGAAEMRLVKIVQLPEGATRLETLTSIEVKPNQGDNKVVVTTSGRNVKKRVSLDEIADYTFSTIQGVDYENELDVFTISSVHQDADDVYGFLNLYDNLTGELLNKIPIEEPWKEFLEHQVCLDLDTIVQIVKPKNQMFACIVYKLCSTEMEMKQKKRGPVENQKKWLGGFL